MIKLFIGIIDLCLKIISISIVVLLVWSILSGGK